MTRRPSAKARTALLGDVLKLLRQRRQALRSVTIHPDGAIEVQLGSPLRVVEPEPPEEDEIARWLREDAEREVSRKS